MVKSNDEKVSIVITAVQYLDGRVVGCRVTVDGEAQPQPMAVPYDGLAVGDEFEAVRKGDVLQNWRKRHPSVR